MRTGRARSSGETSGRHLRFWLAYLVGLAITAVATLAIVVPLSSGIEAQHRVEVHDHALEQVIGLRADVAAFSGSVERGAAAATPADTAQISSSALAATAEVKDAKSTAAAVAADGFSGAAAEITNAQHAYRTAVYALGPVAAGVRGPETDALMAAERTAFTRLSAVLTETEASLEAARDNDERSASASLGQARSTAIVLGILIAIGLVANAVVFSGRGRRRERDEQARARRQEYEAALQDALEMAKSEAAVYEIVHDALVGSLPDVGVEVLVADSSRAHFHKVLDTAGMDPGEAPGCGVASPLECPATTRGHTLVFESSGALNACPYLKHGYATSCSAVCVPISIAGNTVGVTHATGADGARPATPDVQYLELTSRRASERIGMLRAFEKSEAQARSDPLTGLWNRRSLENRVRDLQREGTSYALAYGDLDHFKVLNDTHGHEAGDQALRLFSRVLRDSIRPNDVAARYGGEEFVVLLPECNVEAATIVLERVRERLALALTAGRVPAFTVSFGITSSNDADTFDEVLAIADHALLAAKSSGRNRVVIAPESAEPAESTEPTGHAEPTGQQETARAE